MTLPASVRVNAQFPFPSLVQGSGPVRIGKANGIWTVSFDIVDLTTITPPSSAYATDFVIVWDNVQKNFFKVSIASFPGTSRVQRSVTASPIVVQGNDQVLNCNFAGGGTCTLPSYTTRNGIPLTFKDVGGLFNPSNPLTISAAAGETIDGQASIRMQGSSGGVRQALTLNPFTDGTNTGWFLT